MIKNKYGVGDFDVQEQILTDGSKVYAVKGLSTNSDHVITIDCDTQETAETLVYTLYHHAVNVIVEPCRK